MKRKLPVLTAIIALFVTTVIAAYSQTEVRTRVRTSTTTTLRNAATTTTTVRLTTTTARQTGSFTLPPLDYSQTANVTIYTDGAGKLTFKPIASVVPYYVELRGNSSYKMLWFKIAKNGGPAHDLKLDLSSSRDFDSYYIFKDGPGTYTVTVYGADSISATSYKGLAQFTVKVSQNMPSNIPGYYLNDKALAFVNAHMGQTVGRGECWDVAQEALDSNGADWTRPTEFGLALNPAEDTILPGDIIQFKSVKLVEETERSTRTMTIGAPDHTAVVYEVLGPLHYRLAHQNVNGKRYIIVEEINLNFRVSGSMWFYRPVMGLFRLEDLNR